MTMVDTSTLLKYEVTLTAPDDCVLWGTDSETYTIRQTRRKGSRKDLFWSKVSDEASTGIYAKSCAPAWVKNVTWDIPTKS